MTLKEKIQADIIAAMRAKETTKLDALRMLKNAIMQWEVADVKKEAQDADVTTIIQKEVKKRKDAADQYRQGNRPELAEKEETEGKILAEYLPAQMSEAEIRGIVQKAITESGAKSKKEMGLVMKVLMPQVKGKADGGVVNKIVNEMLPA